MIKKHLPHVLIICFVLIYWVFAIVTYKDYGITADEELEYRSGNLLLNYYITGETPDHAGVSERHKPEKSIYFRGYTALLSAINIFEYYEWYHLLNLVLGSVILFIAYYLLQSVYSNPYISLLGPASILLTPRFLGHIPANPKDIPFAISYFVALFLIYLLKEKHVEKTTKLIILGLVFGVTQSLRTVGFSLYIIYIIYNLSFEKTQWKSTLKSCITDILGISLVSLSFMIITWPYIRKDFPDSLVQMFFNASSYEEWDKEILFNGEYFTKYYRPQQYLPVWLLITTPWPFLIYSLVSPLIVKKSTNQRARDLYKLLTLSFLISMALYFFIKPTVYNGLRHFLYLLPMINIIALISMIESFFHIDNITLKKILATLNIIYFAVTAITMYKLHPYEYIYFNEFIGLPGAKGRFEMDYWGASYKESAEWFRDNRHNLGSNLKVYACNLSYAVQYYAHGAFELVDDTKEANYVMCDYERDIQEGHKGEVVHEVKRLDTTINLIRKVPQ